MIKRTGVYATKEEAKAIREKFKMPVMSFDGFTNIGGSPREFLHSIALSHGLPEIDGYYGLSEDDEFTKVE